MYSISRLLFVFALDRFTHCVKLSRVLHIRLRLLKVSFPTKICTIYFVIVIVALSVIIKLLSFGKRKRVKNYFKAGK